MPSEARRALAVSLSSSENFLKLASMRSLVILETAGSQTVFSPTAGFFPLGCLSLVFAPGLMGFFALAGIASKSFLGGSEKFALNSGLSP